MRSFCSSEMKICARNVRIDCSKVYLSKLQQNVAPRQGSPALVDYDTINKSARCPVQLYASSGCYASRIYCSLDTAEISNINGFFVLYHARISVVVSAVDHCFS